MNRRRCIELVLLLVLFVASLLLRLSFLMGRDFDGLYGQDAYAYYDFADELRMDISEGHPPAPFFWPLGYPALLAAGFALFGTQAATGLIMNLVLGALLSPLVYILARQMGGGVLGAVAAAIIMALCGQAIQSSLVIMSDIPALAWAAIGAVCFWMFLKRPGTSPKRDKIGLFLAAFFLAFACVTRWLYLALIVPFGLAALLRRGSWRELSGAIVVGGLVLLPQVIYSRTNPYPALNHAWVEGWSPANAFRREFTNVDGHFVYDKANAVYYTRPFYDPYYLSPVFSVFVLLGLGKFIRRRRFAECSFLVGWALLPYLFLIGIPYQNIRFPLIVVPAVAALTGIGLDAALVWIRQYLRRRFAVYVLAGGLIVFGAAQMWAAARDTIGTFIANQERDLQTAAWTAQNVPSGATLYTFGLTLTLRHHTPLNVYEIYYETPQTLAARWIHGRDDYLLLNLWQIQNQWAGREPDAAYRWLRDQRGLEQIARYGNYTLFKVRG